MRRMRADVLSAGERGRDVGLEVGWPHLPDDELHSQRSMQSRVNEITLKDLQKQKQTRFNEANCKKEEGREQALRSTYNCGFVCSQKVKHWQVGTKLSLYYGHVHAYSDCNPGISGYRSQKTSIHYVVLEPIVVRQILLMGPSLRSARSCRRCSPCSLAFPLLAYTFWPALLHRTLIR